MNLFNIYCCHKLDMKFNMKIHLVLLQIKELKKLIDSNGVGCNILNGFGCNMLLYGPGLIATCKTPFEQVAADTFFACDYEAIGANLSLKMHFLHSPSLISFLTT